MSPKNNPESNIESATSIIENIKGLGFKVLKPIPEVAHQIPALRYKAPPLYYNDLEIVSYRHDDREKRVVQVLRAIIVSGEKGKTHKDIYSLIEVFTTKGDPVKETMKVIAGTAVTRCNPNGDADLVGFINLQKSDKVQRVGGLRQDGLKSTLRELFSVVIEPSDAVGIEKLGSESDTLEVYTPPIVPKNEYGGDYLTKNTRLWAFNSVLAAYNLSRSPGAQRSCPDND